MATAWRPSTVIACGAPASWIPHTIDGSTSTELTFSRVAVPPEDILARGDKAAAIVSEMQELLILGTAAELLGVAQAALDMTVGYTKLREQFGKLIGSFQALQHRMVDCYVDVELNRSLLFKVLSAWDDDTSHPAMVPAVKARLSKAALKTVRAALQLHGAIGYTEEHDIGVYYKRAVALAASRRATASACCAAWSLRLRSAPRGWAAWARAWASCKSCWGEVSPLCTARASWAAV